MLCTQGIVLRKHRLTESSLIVSWLTLEHGRVRTVAKGALRPKSRLGGILDLFHLCEIQLQPARAGSLLGLRDAVLLESFPGVRTDFVKVTLGAYAVELLDRCIESDSPVPELFDLLKRLLGFLSTQPASQRALHHFEAELTRLLGITQPDQPAARTLEKLLHHLPSSREELLLRLPAR